MRSSRKRITGPALRCQSTTWCPGWVGVRWTLDSDRESRVPPDRTGPIEAAMNTDPMASLRTCDEKPSLGRPFALDVDVAAWLVLEPGTEQVIRCLRNLCPAGYTV